MTDKEKKLLELIFNPYDEPVKEAELNDVEAHWEILFPTEDRR